jgi:hypothetical protein
MPSSSFDLDRVKEQNVRMQLRDFSSEAVSGIADVTFPFVFWKPIVLLFLLPVRRAPADDPDPVYRRAERVLQGSIIGT